MGRGEGEVGGWEGGGGGGSGSYLKSRLGKPRRDSHAAGE